VGERTDELLAAGNAADLLMKAIVEEIVT